ncbi:iron uptake transporter deferrochelatase/peroxidase subunit [Brevibacillus fulvus]|uniref:Deferrochelatase n=1 Tax=Brevibacillus fulvus TaxID=1125967 RepID=A0A938XX04_9BACL|nr:iron uptake transporter deferrochelatase/peroxidase subunit [Brevibacillus fulvus]MBM7591742.1 deferrochelatase/peroxidase EfeB [Brevibacillus fulvus]
MRKISRRELLRLTGAGGLGMLLGGGTLKWLSPSNVSTSAPAASGMSATGQAVPFYGKHQSGIVTPAQDFLYFAAFDLIATDRDEVRILLQKWSAIAARLQRGETVGDDEGKPLVPPVDTGETIGLHPMSLSLTFGVGPSFFRQKGVNRFGLADRQPEVLSELPPFPGDNLKEEWCGGDICVQACANDPQVAFHAIRNLARVARGAAVLRWTQAGFQRTSTADAAKGTPRNLLGFKDGTANPDTTDNEQMNQVVWVQPDEGPDWMVNGSYMVVRRIQMRIEVWDRTTLQEEENTFGRHRESGAPLGKQNEFDPLDLERKNERGELIIPENAHVRLAFGDGTEKILRRSYSYTNGIDLDTGHLDAGLLFICFQRDPLKQFVPIQQRLAKQDALNEYIVHVGSAVFACLPGAQEGGYLGETLFA